MVRHPPRSRCQACRTVPIIAVDPRASARVPGYLETTAFRISFVGQTASLRSFLNKLASFELPVLVREVEVEPASANEAAEPAAVADEGANAAPSVVLAAKPASKPAVAAVRPSGAAPIVTKPWCRFTVTVEYIELVAPSVADASPEAGKNGA
jgi:hypothetical protein